MYLKVAKLSYIILGDFFNCQISCSIGMLKLIFWRNLIKSIRKYERIDLLAHILA